MSKDATHKTVFTFMLFILVLTIAWFDASPSQNSVGEIPSSRACIVKLEKRAHTSIYVQDVLRYN